MPPTSGLLTQSMGVCELEMRSLNVAFQMQEPVYGL